MTIEIVMNIFALFFFKHFVIDFMLQTPYQFLNKGTYGHPGGILHAGLHAIGTFAVLIYYVAWWPTMVAAIVDGIVHYHIDWAKMKINERKQLKCNESNQFWINLGFDQYLHYMTYFYIIKVLI